MFAPQSGGSVWDGETERESGNARLIIILFK